MVIAGALLKSCEVLLEKGIHPTIISEGFSIALGKALEYLEEIKTPVDLNNRQQLIECVTTSLSSKVLVKSYNLGGILQQCSIGTNCCGCSA